MAGTSGSFGGAGCAPAAGGAVLATAGPPLSDGATATVAVALLGSSGLTAALAIVFSGLAAAGTIVFALALLADLAASAGGARADSALSCEFPFFGRSGAFLAPCCASAVGMIEATLSFSTSTYPKSVFKTDFGYVLVEKDKVASIIPTAEAQQGAKNAPERPKNGNSQLKAESALAPPADAAKSASNASAKTIVPAAANPEKTIASAAVKPELPKSATATVAVAPSLKGGPAVASTAPPAAGAQPAPPNEPEVPAIREDVQGNLYSNHTHGFRMYKAPSWQLIDDARNALPNAIVAMGTSNESTLMVVGREKTKEPLDAAAGSV